MLSIKARSGESIHIPKTPFSDSTNIGTHILEQKKSNDKATRLLMITRNLS